MSRRDRLAEALLVDDRGWRALATLVVVALVVPTLLAWPLLNHDVASIAMIADRTLGHETLYTDLPDPNPPLVFWLFTPALALARATGLAWPHVVVLWILTLSLGLVALLARVASALALPAGLEDRRALVLAVAAIHVGWVGYELGQREQLAILAWLPHALATAAAVQGRRLPVGLAVGAGLASGLGLSLKPFFPPIWALSELLVLASTRRLSTVLRVENGVTAAVIAVYGAAAVLGTTYLDQLGQWLAGYGAYDTSAVALLLALRPAHLLAMAAVAVAARRGPDAAGVRPLDAVLGVGLGVGLAAAWVQGKGFAYHAWPSYSLGATLVVLAVLQLGPQATLLRRPALLVAGAAVAMVLTDRAVFASVPGLRNAHDRFPCPTQDDPRARCSLHALVDALDPLVGPDDPVSWLAFDAVPTAQGVAALGGRLIQRTAVMHIPSAYTPEERGTRPFPYHPLSSAPAVEQEVRAGLTRDLQREPPVVIVVDHRAVLQSFGRTDFDLLHWLRLDPALAAWLDAHYTSHDVRDVTHGTFTVLRRRSAP